MAFRELAPVFQFTGAAIGFNPQDRFMMALGNTPVVVTQNGSVFGADVAGHNLAPVFQFSGAAIGFNPQDWAMMALGNTLVVVTRDGSVFGADVTGRNLGPVFEFSGAKIGFNPQDKFMMALGNTLVVVTQDGSVFGADVTGRNLGPVFEFSGAKIGFNPQDRFMMALGNTLIVVTHDGSVFGADVVEAETATFDSGDLTSDLALGGSVQLVMRRNGDFTFSCHAHDSGFDNIDYVVSAVLMTPSGIAFTFQHQGNVEGTIAGLPFKTPRRNDDFITGGNNPSIANEFEGMSGAKLAPSIAGKDTLVAGLEGELADLLKTAGEELGKAAAGAVIALVF